MGSKSRWILASICFALGRGSEKPTLAQAGNGRTEMGGIRFGQGSAGTVLKLKGLYRSAGFGAS